MKTSALLTSQTDPIALFYLASEYVKVAGFDAAIAKADYYATAARHITQRGGSGTGEEQAASAIYEAVEIARSSEREREQMAKERAA